MSGSAPGIAGVTVALELKFWSRPGCILRKNCESYASCLVVLRMVEMMPAGDFIELIVFGRCVMMVQRADQFARRAWRRFRTEFVEIFGGQIAFAF